MFKTMPRKIKNAHESYSKQLHSNQNNKNNNIHNNYMNQSSKQMVDKLNNCFKMDNQALTNHRLSNSD